MHATEELQVISGRIDLLLDDGGDFAIIDHKSFPGSMELDIERLRAFGGQLSLYSRALNAFLRVPNCILSGLIWRWGAASREYSPFGEAMQRAGSGVCNALSPNSTRRPMNCSRRRCSTSHSFRASLQRAGSSKAFVLIDETIRSAEVNGDLCYMPEVLRVKGNLVLAAPQPRADEAEMYFTRSLELSRRQGAQAWELRTAIDFATLLATRDESEHAREILTSVFERCGEGLDTSDLKCAGDAWLA
ncbi:MAG TPA: hypothetical protein VI256_02165 [Roseiarcus sp.]